MTEYELAAVDRNIEVEIIVRTADLNHLLDDVAKPVLLFSPQLFGSGKTFLGTHAVEILANDVAHSGPISASLRKPNIPLRKEDDRCDLSNLRQLS